MNARTWNVLKTLLAAFSAFLLPQFIPEVVWVYVALLVVLSFLELTQDKREKDAEREERKKEREADRAFQTSQHAELKELWTQAHTLSTTGTTVTSGITATATIENPGREAGELSMELVGALLAAEGDPDGDGTLAYMFDNGYRKTLEQVRDRLAGVGFKDLELDALLSEKANIVRVRKIARRLTDLGQRYIEGHSAP